MVDRARQDEIELRLLEEERKRDARRLMEGAAHQIENPPRKLDPGTHNPRFPINAG